MKFFDKLNFFLIEMGVTEKNVFIPWLIKQAQLNCDVDAISYDDQDNNEVSFDVSKISVSDFKKLLIFFKLPVDTLSINNQLFVSNQFLNDSIFDQIKNDLRNLVQNRKEKQSIDPMSFSPEESEDDDFVIIDSNDEGEKIDFETFPWLNPKHPLYFPATQSDGTSLTRWEAVDKFSVENWYPHLEKYTFVTTFIKLDYDDIQFLMGNGSPEYDSTLLEHSFDHFLSQLRNQEAFMRLSSRSPKDSKALFDEAATIMSKDFSNWNEFDNKNQQLVAFVASMTKAMKITSGRKIIETIQQSPRVHNDLIALMSTASRSNCTTNIVLREWYSIRPDHEFRAFVSRRCRKESIVTAIAQYFHFLYFDKAPTDCFNFLEEDTKKNLILKFQNYILKSIDPAVANFLNFASEQDDDNSIDCIREYIVDIALIPINQYHGEMTDDNTIHIGGSTYIIMVIELNPFAPSATGCALFNWKTDLDMLWGKASCDYPVFSYRTQPREDLRSVTLLPSNHQEVIQKAREKRISHSTAAVITPVSPQLETPVSILNQGQGFFSMPVTSSCTKKADPDTFPSPF
ncbi:D123 [Legionella wadsworthii]|uniref:D123 n=1 Tax=Legionella wadsworthii TaxID=28088 RepID=A0A378LV70_9GAMM|nr:hypothetical protein [Legionella wadsworthii]STY31289.1 D123 [Legionella wadsworthii]